MRAALSSVAVQRPRSLRHALEILAAPGERAVPLAGGTDLFVALNAGTHEGRRFLDLWGLKDLNGIHVGRGGITFGALATFTEIREHPSVRRRFPSLVAAAAEVGARPIQNRATIAGNVANASPAGDSLPVLLAHDALVHVGSVRGERTLPFETLYRGYRSLAVDPDELITAISLPSPPAGAATFFRKVGTRRAQSISKVVFAGVLAFGRDRRVRHVRLAWGSVAPVTLRARAAEAGLLGQRPSAPALEAARRALDADLSPIDDIRSDRAYRLEVAGNLLQQFLGSADRRYLAD